jgi:hypothetical protein
MHWEPAQRERLEDTQQIQASDSNPATKQSTYRTGYYSENIYQHFPDFFFFFLYPFSLRKTTMKSHTLFHVYRVPELTGIQNYKFIYWNDFI